MSRELDFIDYINENAAHKDQTPNSTFPLTNSDFIESALNCLDEYPEEKIAILKYQEILQRIKSEQDDGIIAILQDTKEALEVHLQSVIDSEKRKAYLHAARAGREALERQKALYEKRVQQRKQSIPCSAPPSPPPPKKPPCQDSFIYTGKEQKIMNILTSKRIAAVISIFLCVALYFALLNTAFTQKVNTYICYITEDSDAFHDIECRALRGTAAQETTVYAVQSTHVRCTYCTPTDKITLTERNYLAPLLISIPISGIVFYILTKKGKAH